VLPVATEAQATALIEQYKKKYWDARHNCYAYSIGYEQPLLRFSDDGEPSGTAGKPILEVITAQALHNVLVIVTRYFGGTLLGTGGLVRAYTQATKEGIANSTVVTQRYGREFCILVNYTDIGKLQYLFAKESIDVVDTVYESDVRVTLLVPAFACDRVIQQITEVTSGQAVIEEVGTCYYFAHEGKYKIEMLT
jgi:uncharacterized YigZ family protein